jgi:CPA1 family monovalent cation:H+ antiporter
MHEEVVTTVVGIIGLLLVAAATAIGLKRARLPYTVGLVLVGLVLGALAHRTPFLEPFQQLQLSPELILFVFLPTLIFESAFSLDSRLLSRNLAPVLILAAPGLLISTAIVGGMLSWLTPLDLGPALLFGALISATDPVAVIALFREVGAPKRLAILVEGESLFNDATAIVLFGIIFEVLRGGTLDAATVGSGVLEFLFVFIGGLLVGAAIGYIMIRSIALAKDEPLVEVALSTVVAYAAFIAADHYLHVSGVMATVGAGLVVGTLGSTRFSPAVRSYLHQFWDYAAFVANSLIFLMVGISVSLRGVLDHIGIIGWAVLAVLIARALTVYGLIPIVSRLPNADPIDGRMRTVMFWGGLRGAVALALVWSLPESFAPRELLIPLAVGIVLFTLLSGGLTMAPLIRALGLNAPTLVEHVASAQANLAAKRAALGRLGDLVSTRHFSNRLLGEVESQYEEEVSAAEAQVAAVQKQCTVDDMRLVIWSEALTTERTAYRDLFDHGAISEPVYKELELSNELRRDRLKRGMFPTKLLAATPLEVRLTDRFFCLVASIAPRARMVQRHRIRALAAQYELGSAAVEGSRRVVDEVQHLGALSHAPADLIEECRSAYRAIGETAMNQIDDIAEHFPEYVQAVQRQTARRMALDGESDAIRDLAHSGGIPDSVARAAQRDIQAALQQLARQPVAELAPKPEELLARVPFFEDLSPEHFGRIADALVPRTVLPGEAIINQGERGRSLFLIARGVVAVLISQVGEPPRRVASLHAGDFFGEMALLSDAPRNATVQAVTGCQLYELAKRDVDAICETFPGIKRALVSAFESRSSDTVTPVRRSSGYYEV